MKDDDLLAGSIALRALTRNVIEYLRLKQIQKPKVSNGNVDEPHNERGEPEDRPDERPRGDLSVVE